ncbi:MAG TPA: hypothetical protein VLH08_12225 [Acidobacteriota bacterium]|nr:hypothetical protein [Acidobacteriota bacterium]
MKKVWSIFLLISVIISSQVFAAYPEEYPIYLRLLGFTKGEVDYMKKGRMVTHTIENKAPGEFGIIAAQVYNVPVYFYRDFFRYAENYGSILKFEQIGTFKSKPTLQDLKSLKLSESEVHQFLKCRHQTCDFLLTAEEKQRIPETADLTTAVGLEAATDVYRQILLNRLINYQANGIHSFDQIKDSNISSGLIQEHLHRFPHLDAYFPRVEEHILDFPKSKTSDDFFYWTKEQLGAKPIINLRHVFSQRVGEDYVQASLLIYSNHSYISSISVTHLINYSDSQVPRTLVITAQRTITDLHGNVIRSLSRNVLRSNLEKRVTAWIKVVAKTMEDRYLDNVVYRNFPNGLIARDQR